MGSWWSSESKHAGEKEHGHETAHRDPKGEQDLRTGALAHADTKLPGQRQNSATGLTPKLLLATLSLDDKKLKSKKLVCCYANEKARDALNDMVLHQLSCLPVFEKNRAGDNTGKESLVGVIDMVDIVNLVAKLHGSTAGWPPSLRYGHAWTQWDSATVKEAMHDGKRTPGTVSIHGSMLDAARVLMAYRIPRVLLHDDNEKICSLVTQSDVVNALYDHLPKLDQATLNRPVSQFHRIVQGDTLVSLSDWPTMVVKDGKNLVAIGQDKLAIEAFQLMAAEQVSAIPVIADNQSQKLLGSISARDIRDIVHEDDFPKTLYTLNTLQFAQKMHERRDAHNAALFVALTPEQTFKDVVATLHQFKIHRVWVADGQGTVRHVLSLTDVLDEVLNR
mmetsp:Transcript_50313/g.109043  ORF Transcript_50313/g.109043 Transcript_50313/m.109043 type:complete len:391 (+) Transcript_50313:248-1420(+)